MPQWHVPLFRVLHTPTGEVHIATPVSDDDLFSYCIEEQGGWFESEIQFLREWFPSGGHAIDVGANLGAYALELAQKSKPDGKVWAFEPDPRTRELLLLSQDKNGFRRLIIEPAALGAREGEVSFALADDPELSRLQSTKNGPLVHMTTLDLWHASSGQPPIDFVKLDAEGAEPDILRGGKEFFSSVQPLVLLEYHRPDGSNDEAVGELKKIGYEIFRYLPAFHVLVPAHLPRLGSDAPLNLIAVSTQKIAPFVESGILSLLDSSPTPTETLPPSSENNTPAQRYESAVRQFSGWHAHTQHKTATTCLIRSHFLEQLGFSASCVAACKQGLECLRDGQIGVGNAAVAACGIGAPPSGQDYPLWLAASFLDRVEIQVRPTSYFHPDETVSLLSQIEQFGHLTPALRQRLQAAQKRLKKLAASGAASPSR